MDDVRPIGVKVLPKSFDGERLNVTEGVLTVGPKVVPCGQDQADQVRLTVVGVSAAGALLDCFDAEGGKTRGESTDCI